ncbi:MAG: hypothetical protein ACAI35_18780 [Candidatus Methylacidiphilales bacterium]|nr:hypothetical protein [Candidatus Methylacidiphilales bacterium]
MCISLPLTSVSLIYGWMDMEGRAGEEYYRRNPEPALESDGFPRGENDGLAILVISHFLALCSHLSFFGATILIMASPGIQESALALVTPYPPARSAESEVPAAKLGVKECIVACICIPFRLLYTIYWRLQDRIEGRD